MGGESGWVGIGKHFVDGVSEQREMGYRDENVILLYRAISQDKVTDETGEK